MLHAGIIQLFCDKTYQSSISLASQEKNRLVEAVQQAREIAPEIVTTLEITVCRLPVRIHRTPELAGSFVIISHGSGVNATLRFAGPHMGFKDFKTSSSICGVGGLTR